MPWSSTSTQRWLHSGSFLYSQLYLFITLKPSTNFLRYQVRYAVPNAIQYGAPQARNRVIFLAARCGIPLPNIPEPTHSHPKPLDHSTPIEKYQLPRVSRSLLRDYPNLEQKIHYDDQFHIEGPHAYVTIDDTISDLVRAFHRLAPRSPVDRKTSSR